MLPDPANPLAPYPAGDEVRRLITLRIRVVLSDGTRPAGRLVVRRAGQRRVREKRVLRASADGRLRVRVRGLAAGRRTLVVTYRDRTADRVRDRIRVRITYVPPGPAPRSGLISYLR